MKSPGKPFVFWGRKMKIVLNGKEETVLQPMTISEFIEARGWAPDRIVVALNLDFIRQDSWSEVLLKEGDHIDILSFVSGG